jgi:hypothetical protein
MQDLLRGMTRTVVDPFPDILSSIFWIDGLVQKGSPDGVLGCCELGGLN